MMENIVTQTRTKEASVTHRIQEMEEPQALMIQKIRLHQTKKMLKKKPLTGSFREIWTL